MLLPRRSSNFNVAFVFLQRKGVAPRALLPLLTIIWAMARASGTVPTSPLMMF
jgi:hypothetical protein